MGAPNDETKCQGAKLYSDLAMLISPANNIYSILNNYLAAKIFLQMCFLACLDLLS